MLDTMAINYNTDGSLDYGVMQLNSSWYDVTKDTPARNITAACGLITELRGKELNWWQTAIAYNCGYKQFLNGAPATSITYANKVFKKWEELDPRFVQYVGH